MEKEMRRGTKADRWTSREEEKVWVQFYRRAGDPVIAADLIEQLESDREVKARHFGLYLRCRQSLRKDKARRARAKLLAHGVHVMGRLLVGWPLEVIRDSLSFLSAVGVAWAGADEPAVRQMQKIRRSRQAVKPTAVPEEDVKAKAKQA